MTVGADILLGRGTNGN